MSQLELLFQSVCLAISKYGSRAHACNRHWKWAYQVTKIWMKPSLATRECLIFVCPQEAHHTSRHQWPPLQTQQRPPLQAQYRRQHDQPPREQQGGLNRSFLCRFLLGWRWRMSPFDRRAGNCRPTVLVIHFSNRNRLGKADFFLSHGIDLSFQFSYFSRQHIIFFPDLWYPKL